MPYYVTENFAAGIDTRKHPLTAPAGTLRQLSNAHLTPGGEIEKRLAFVKAITPATAPLDRGLVRVGAICYVISAAAPELDVIYGGLTFRYLQAAGADPDEDVLDWDVFGGRVYFTTNLAGATKHYYQDLEGGSTASEVPDGKGRFVRTYQEKIYSCAGKVIYFCAIGDPTDWSTTEAGAGFIDASNNDAEALDLSGLEVYYDQLAFFSSRAILVWNMDTDPANNIQSQTIRSIGLAARATPRQYGSGDILFVAPSGIRSLQARDSSNSASVSDVGSPIDRDIIQKLKDNTQEFVDNTQSMLEDLTGRYWVMFKDEMWVLSLFPGPKVSAWSRYLPTYNENGLDNVPFVPETLVDAGGFVCVLGEENGVHSVWVLGGQLREEYDQCDVEIITPYLNLERPASWKQFIGYDAAVDGIWNFEVSYDPDNIVWEPVGTLTKSSYNDQKQALRGFSSSVSMRIKNSTAGYARIANVAVHYNLSKDD